MIDLTPIFQAVIALLAALITYKLIPWIKSRTTAQQQENLAAAAKIAVYAAEQIFGSLEEQNKNKLAYAMERLRSAGFTLDEETLRGAVETAVYQMKPEARLHAAFHAADEWDDEGDEDDEDGADFTDDLPEAADVEEFESRSPWPEAAEDWNDPAASGETEDAPGVTGQPPDGEA